MRAIKSSNDICLRIEVGKVVISWTIERESDWKVMKEYRSIFKKWKRMSRMGVRQCYTRMMRRTKSEGLKKVLNGGYTSASRTTAMKSRTMGAQAALLCDDSSLSAAYAEPPRGWRGVFVAVILVRRREGAFSATSRLARGTFKDFLVAPYFLETLTNEKTSFQI